MRKNKYDKQSKKGRSGLVKQELKQQQQQQQQQWKQKLKQKQSSFLSATILCISWSSVGGCGDKASHLEVPKSLFTLPLSNAPTVASVTSCRRNGRCCAHHHSTSTYNSSFHTTSTAVHFSDDSVRHVGNLSARVACLPPLPRVVQNFENFASVMCGSKHEFN